MDKYLRIIKAITFLAIIALLSIIVIKLSEKRKNDFDISILEDKIDSLKASYIERESKIDTLKVIEKTIYQKSLTKSDIENIILKHEKERILETRTKLPSCDTLANNYAKTIVHLNNVEQQKNHLDTAFKDCKETVEVMV